MACCDPQNQGAGGTAASSGVGFAAADPAAGATRIVALQEAVTAEELANDEEYDDILADMREECSKVRRCLISHTWLLDSAHITLCICLLLVTCASCVRCSKWLLCV